MRPKKSLMRPYLYYKRIILIVCDHFILFICGGMSRNQTGDLNSEKVESCKAFILMSLILKFHCLFQSMILIWKFLKLIMSKFVIFSFQRGNHVLKCAPRLQAFLIICWLGICKIIDTQGTPIFRLSTHNWSICSTLMPAYNEGKLYGYFSQL